MKVAVVTPTIGSEHLKKCLESVDKQIYENLTHYIFVDGEEHKERVFDMCEGASRTKFVTLEENVGKGWYGHRVYSACSFLVNADVICYLDEDNFYEPCHVEKLLNKIKNGNDWAYSLRKIYNKDGEYVCEDNCESLGKWPVYFNDNVFHIDTSSFAVKQSVATRIGHAWYGQWGADRQFFNALKQNFTKFECTNAHTLGYRLDGNADSVKVEFFEQGNKLTFDKYNGNFPWKKQIGNIIKDPTEDRVTYVGPGIKIIG